MTADARLDAQSIERYIAQWQGRIAASAGDDGGLDAFRQALAAIRRDVPLERGLRDHAAAKIWDAGVRHVGGLVGREPLASMYMAGMSEPPAGTAHTVGPSALGVEVLREG